MKAKIFILSAVIAMAVACSNGNENNNENDSANRLNDTLPANGPGDTIGLDSNPPDATKIDSGNRDTH
jgi:hypothetical protein